MSGLIYLIAALLLGFGFVYHAIQMRRIKDTKTAMKTFWFSIIYITALFAALLVDHYIRLSL
jgi:heme o synthase